MPFGGYNPLDDGEYEDFSPWGSRREQLITEKRLHEITEITEESVNDEGFWTVKFKTKNSSYI